MIEDPIKDLTWVDLWSVNEDPLHMQDLKGVPLACLSYVRTSKAGSKYTKLITQRNFSYTSVFYVWNLPEALSGDLPFP